MTQYSIWGHIHTHLKSPLNLTSSMYHRPLIEPQMLQLSPWNVNLCRTSKIQYFLDYTLCGFMWYVIYILIYATCIIYHILHICMFMHIHNVYDEYVLRYIRCHILKFKNVQWKGTERIDLRSQTWLNLVCVPTIKKIHLVKY